MPGTAGPRKPSWIVVITLMVLVLGAGGVGLWWALHDPSGVPVALDPTIRASAETFLYSASDDRQPTDAWQKLMALAIDVRDEEEDGQSRMWRPDFHTFSATSQRPHPCPQRFNIVLDFPRSIDPSQLQQDPNLPPFQVPEGQFPVVGDPWKGGQRWEPATLGGLGNSPVGSPWWEAHQPLWDRVQVWFVDELPAARGVPLDVDPEATPDWRAMHILTMAAVEAYAEEGTWELFTEHLGHLLTWPTLLATPDPYRYQREVATLRQDTLLFLQTYLRDATEHPERTAEIVRLLRDTPTPPPPPVRVVAAGAILETFRQTTPGKSLHPRSLSALDVLRVNTWRTMLTTPPTQHAQDFLAVHATWEALRKQVPSGWLSPDDDRAMPAFLNVWDEMHRVWLETLGARLQWELAAYRLAQGHYPSSLDALLTPDAPADMTMHLALPWRYALDESRGIYTLSLQWPAGQSPDAALTIDFPTPPHDD